MARLVGINLPDDKRIEYALTKVYGVGWHRSGLILAGLKIDTYTKVKDLTEEQLKSLQTAIEKVYKVEGDLKEEINSNIKRLREVNAYRGVRHVMGLPSHGQRTKSNARTRRGKRRTVGAMKKEDLARMQASSKK